jgi:hypothetical protein
MGLVLRPLIFVLLFGTAAWIGRAILRHVPEGPVKRVLARPVPIRPRTEAERRSWFPLLVWLGMTVVVWGGIALLMWVNE